MSDPQSHPAVRAAKMIRELHEANIKKIDEGFVFFRVEPDGTQTNVNDVMRAQCVKQIALCDQVIASAPELQGRMLDFAIIAEDVETLIDKADKEDRTLASMLPEIGNFDHEKN